MSSIPPQKSVSRTELKSCAPSEYLKKYLASRFKFLGDALSIDLILLLMLIMLAVLKRPEVSSKSWIRCMLWLLRKASAS